MTLHQGDLITDTSFNALVCDVDDIIPRLEDQGLSNKEAIVIGQKLIDSDHFRKKFVDCLMESFSDQLDYLVEDWEQIRL